MLWAPYVHGLGDHQLKIYVQTDEIYQAKGKDY